VHEVLEGLKGAMRALDGFHKSVTRVLPAWRLSVIDIDMQCDKSVFTNILSQRKDVDAFAVFTIEDKRKIYHKTSSVSVIKSDPLQSMIRRCRV
jgi:hypothetical protein